MVERLDDSFFEMALNCQHNMSSFEKLIQHLDENRKQKESNEVDIDKLQEQSEQLANYMTNKMINSNANQQKNDVIEIRMIVTSIAIKIFIGQVPKTWRESELQIFFEKHTSITQIEVVEDDRGRHQGCAFAMFSSLTEAEKVIELYSNQHFPNTKQKINMKWALGEDERLGTSENSAHKIMIKNLPPLISDRSLLNIFQNFGLVSELKIIRDNVTRECKGQAFIKYLKKESAHLAVQNINQQDIFLCDNKKLKVSFLEKSFQKKKRSIEKHLKNKCEEKEEAQLEPMPTSVPFAKYYYEYRNVGDIQPIYYHPLSDKLSYKQPPPSSLVWHQDGSCTIVSKLFPCHIDFTKDMKKKKSIMYTPQQLVVQGPSFSNVFIFHLPKQYVEKDVYELFTGYGTILSVSVCRKLSGDSKGYGFVSFSHPSEAADAIKDLNGLLILNKRIKVELKQSNEERNKSQQKTLDYKN